MLKLQCQPTRQKGGSFAFAPRGLDTHLQNPIASAALLEALTGPQRHQQHTEESPSAASLDRFKPPFPEDATGSTVSSLERGETRLTPRSTLYR